MKCIVEWDVYMDNGCEYAGSSWTNILKNDVISPKLSMFTCSLTLVKEFTEAHTFEPQV